MMTLTGCAATRDATERRAVIDQNRFRRVHAGEIAGRGVLPRWRAIVFVNGCFWHMHEGCPKCVIPKSNVDFWTAKLIRNRERDARQIAGLERDGWRVFVVWECELGRAMRTCTLDALHARIVGGWVPSASDRRATVRIPSSVE